MSRIFARPPLWPAQAVCEWRNHDAALCCTQVPAVKPEALLHQAHHCIHESQPWQLERRRAHGSVDDSRSRIYEEERLPKLLLLDALSYHPQQRRRRDRSLAFKEVEGAADIVVDTIGIF